MKHFIHPFYIPNVLIRVPGERECYRDPLFTPTFTLLDNLLVNQLNLHVFEMWEEARLAVVGVSSYTNVIIPLHDTAAFVQVDCSRILDNDRNGNRK